MYNILVCDDEKDIVNALEIYLRMDDYRVFPARNGREALEIIGKQEIHLVLLDIMMPEMDGMETLARIRKIRVPKMDLNPMSRSYFSELVWGEMGRFVRGLLMEEA